MKALEIYDILTLEDNKDYTVANMVEYHNSTYLYLIEVDEEEEIKEGNQQIVRLVMQDGSASVEKVVDEDEYKEVAKIFFDLFKDLAEKELKEESEQ